MNNRLDGRKKNMHMFLVLCCLAYFTAYITRKTFAASMVEMIEATAFTRTELGFAVTCNFICYGIGQVISGFIGEKIRPRVLITVGLVGSGLCNIAIPFCTSVVLVCVVWGINGFLQSMLWPPMVRAMNEQFTPEFYTAKVSWVSTASALASAVDYVLVFLCVKYTEWRISFWIAAGFAFASAVIWWLGAGICDNYLVSHPFENAVSAEDEPKEEKKKYTLGKLVAVSGMAFLFLSIIFQGVLRDGIETWLPTFIHDEYGLETSGAIITAVILPVLAISGYKFGGFVQKFTKEPIKASAIVWCVSFCASIVLLLFYKTGVVIGVAFSALMSGLAHSANLLLVSHSLLYFRKTGHVSTVAGLMNASTYIGSAVSMYGIAAITENASWEIVFTVFAVVAALGIAVSLMALKPWSRFIKE